MRIQYNDLVLTQSVLLCPKDRLSGDSCQIVWKMEMSHSDHLDNIVFPLNHTFFISANNPINDCFIQNLLISVNL